MNSYKFYRIIILLAGLIWFLSYVGELKMIYPYSIFGFYISPILLIFGMIGYLILKIKKKELPDYVSEYNNMIGFLMIYTNHYFRKRLS